MELGKINEHPWDIRHGSECTEHQCSRRKKDRTHYLLYKKSRWNKKYGVKEYSKKGSKEILLMRCS